MRKSSLRSISSTSRSGAIDFRREAACAPENPPPMMTTRSAAIAGAAWTRGARNGRAAPAAAPPASLINRRRSMVRLLGQGEFPAPLVAGRIRPGDLDHRAGLRVAHHEFEEAFFIEVRPRLHAEHQVAVELAVDLADEGGAAGRRSRGVADLDAKLGANEDADVGVLLLLQAESPDGDVADHESLPYERTSLRGSRPGW